MMVGLPFVGGSSTSVPRGRDLLELEAMAAPCQGGLPASEAMVQPYRPRLVNVRVAAAGEMTGVVVVVELHPLTVPVIDKHRRPPTIT